MFSRFLYRAITAEKEIKKHDRNNVTVPTIFMKRMKRNPQKPCFFFEDQIWTFSDVRIK